MLAAINRGKQKIDMDAFLQGAIENKLIADHGVNTYGIDTFFPKSRVGFDLDIALEDQYINVMRLNYEKELLDYIGENFKDGTLESSATQPFSMTHEELEKIAEQKNIGTLDLLPEQVEVAKKTELLRYQFPSQKTDTAITLWDVYSRQNIQGRDTIHKGDINYLRLQIKQRVGALFVDYWINTHSDLNAHDIDIVKQFIFNKHFKQKFLVKQGLVQVIHVDNPRLSEKAKTITQPEITKYYQANKEEFRLILSARGRQIQSKNEDNIYAAAKAINKGTPFEKVAKQYSELKDSEGEVQINTGWIKREDKNQPWLQTLLYTQPLNRLSRPFRSPQTKGNKGIYWQLVIVDEREEGYQAPDSDGVRYEVSKILAQRKLGQEFAELRKTLSQKTRIQLNPNLLQLNKAKKKHSTTTYKRVHKHEH